MCVLNCIYISVHAHTCSITTLNFSFRNRTLNEGATVLQHANIPCTHAHTHTLFLFPSLSITHTHTSMHANKLFLSLSLLAAQPAAVCGWAEQLTSKQNYTNTHTTQNECVMRRELLKLTANINAKECTRATRDKV